MDFSNVLYHFLKNYFISARKLLYQLKKKPVEKFLKPSQAW